MEIKLFSYINVLIRGIFGLRFLFTMEEEHGILTF